MALIIVLLVTALLTALIFEFAFGTRVSLRAAANFRNSQRAYFIARSGPKYFAKNWKAVTDTFPQAEWSVVPFISDGDTELRIRWEDEQGKINISVLNTPTSPVTKDVLGWTRLLFQNKGIHQKAVDDMTAKGRFFSVEELHEILSDEEYEKVKDCFTVYTANDGKINFNTASDDVLKSLGIDSSSYTKRKETPYTKDQLAALTLGKTESGLNVNNYLVESSSCFRVSTFAIVGGYTKQVVAVIDLSKGNTPLYWRSL